MAADQSDAEDLSQRFTAMYARVVRPSVSREKLLGALLQQMLCTIRSDRLLMASQIAGTKPVTLARALSFCATLGITVIWRHAAWFEDRR